MLRMDGPGREHGEAGSDISVGFRKEVTFCDNCYHQALTIFFRVACKMNKGENQALEKIKEVNPTSTGMPDVSAFSGTLLR